jgi:hypothetical protein
MKKTKIIIVTMLIVNLNAWSQEEPKTLFGDNLSLANLGIMVEPGAQFTRLAGQGAMFFQFRGGLVLNDKFTVGGFYGILLNDVRPAAFNDNLPPAAHLDSYIAGGFLEYTLFSSKMIHLTFPLSVGLMEIEIDKEGRYFDYEERLNLFIEPSALLEINLHKFARFNAGLGYRIMGSTFQNAVGVPGAGNAITFNMGLKMGLFSFN